MALSTIFGTLTNATGAELDQNFAEVGALGVIPCVATGTNALTLTPEGNTPTIGAYANYLRFSFTATASCTGAVTANVGGLGSLNVYKNAAGGPTALISGDIIISCGYELVYDSALNSGTGGFHLNSPTTFNAGTVTSVAISMPASLFGVAGSPVTSSGTLAVTFTTIAANSLLANATGSAAIPSITALTALMDSALGSTQGDVLFRASGSWTVLGPGSAGQPLVSGGAAANPSFGFTQSLGVAAAGNSQGTATVLTAAYNEVTNVGSGTGVILPPIIKLPITVFNRGASALLIYPPSGAAIDANATNAAVTIATLTVGQYYPTATGQYYTV